MAGKCWFKSFQKRNPTIVLRAPEPTSIARIRGFNKAQVNRFYDLLEEQMVKNNIEPARVRNRGEDLDDQVSKDSYYSRKETGRHCIQSRKRRANDSDMLLQCRRIFHTTIFYF